MVAPQEVDGRVRWKVRGRWRYGRLDRLVVIERDGSLRVHDDYTGGTRSLPAAEVWHQERGPKGGKRWVPSTIAPKVIAVADRLHRPSQMGLFDSK